MLQVYLPSNLCMQCRIPLGLNCRIAQAYRVLGLRGGKDAGGRVGGWDVFTGGEG